MINKKIIQHIIIEITSLREKHTRVKMSYNFINIEIQDSNIHSIHWKVMQIMTCYQ